MVYTYKTALHWSQRERERRAAERSCSGGRLRRNETDGEDITKRKGKSDAGPVEVDESRCCFVHQLRLENE